MSWLGDDEYVVLLLGFIMIFFEAIWIHEILTGNVPPERMGEFIGAILGGLGITVSSFGFFKWYRRKRKQKELLQKQKEWEQEDLKKESKEKEGETV